MKKRTTSSRGRRGASVGLVICFVAVVAMVGVYTFNNYQSNLEKDLAKVEEQVAKGEEEQQDDESEQTSTEQVIPEINEQVQDTENTENNTDETTGQEEPVLEIQEETAQSSSSAVNFAPADNLLWPVEGNIILNYSMDKTVYFTTLDQYKYNPAILISADPGNQVLASAAGTVKSIEESAQLGTMLTLNIGNGYEIVYGQLKDIQFQKGDTVERGAIIGYLNEPSRYYSMEGCNLYYQVLKDGEPVNPMEYLEA